MTKKVLSPSTREHIYRSTYELGRCEDSLLDAVGDLFSPAGAAQEREEIKEQAVRDSIRDGKD